MNNQIFSEERPLDSGDDDVKFVRRKERMITPAFGSVELDKVEEVEEVESHTERRMLEEPEVESDTIAKRAAFKEQKKKKLGKRKIKTQNTEESPISPPSPLKSIEIGDVKSFPTDQGVEEEKIDALTLDPDGVGITLVPENKKYDENIMNGLNVISYLRSKHVPVGNKLFYVAVIILLLAGYVINFWELITYATTRCIDHNSSLGMYVNFFILLFAKGGIFNYITSEINASLQYDLRFPFLIPILSIGVVANFQLPLVIFNYEKCMIRSPILHMTFGYFVVNILAATCAVLIISGLIIVLFSSKCRIPQPVIKMTRTICHFIGISAMLLMNALFVFITFSQLKFFSRTLLIENLLYWILLITGLIVYLIRKKWALSVFNPIPTEQDQEQGQNQNDEEEGGDQTPRLMVDDSRKEMAKSVRNNFSLKKELERIDEHENENERSGSGLKADDKLGMQDEFVLPVAEDPQNHRVFNAPVYRGD